MLYMNVVLNITLKNVVIRKKIMKYKKEAELEGSIGKYFSHKCFPQ